MIESMIIVMVCVSAFIYIIHFISIKLDEKADRERIKKAQDEYYNRTWPDED